MVLGLSESDIEIEGNADLEVESIEDAQRDGHTSLDAHHREPEILGHGIEFDHPEGEGGSSAPPSPSPPPITVLNNSHSHSHSHSGKARDIPVTASKPNFIPSHFVALNTSLRPASLPPLPPIPDQACRQAVLHDPHGVSTVPNVMELAYLGDVVLKCGMIRSIQKLRKETSSGQQNVSRPSRPFDTRADTILPIPYLHLTALAYCRKLNMLMLSLL